MFFSNTCNVIVMITENILAVIIITFKYFSNTFGYYLENLPNTRNKMVTNGNILMRKSTQDK